MRKQRRTTERPGRGALSSAGESPLARAFLELIRAERRLAVGLAAALAVAVLLAFSGSFDNEFVLWDDDRYITENPQIQSLSWSNLAWMLTARPLHWQPLAYLAHAFDWALFGPRAGGHHLTSVLLHGLNAILVAVLFVAFVLARRDARTKDSAGARGLLLGCAGAAALLWAVHPLRVESVAWASQKKDVVCGLLTLACVITWLLFGRAEPKHKRRGLAVAQALGLLALAAKPTAIHLPFTLLLLDAWPLGRLSLRALPRLVIEKLPLFLLVFASAWMTVHPAPEARSQRQKIRNYVAGDQIRVPIRGLTFYVEKTAWPSGLSPLYPLPPQPERSWRSPAMAASLAVALALLGLALGGPLRGRPELAIGVLAYVLMFAPVSGIVEMRAQAAADRFSYLATIPFFLLAAAGAWAALRGAPSERAVGSGLLVVAASAALIGATRAQVEVWRNTETLWARSIAEFPRRIPEAYVNLAHELLARPPGPRDPARRARAEGLLREAVAAFPNNAAARMGLAGLCAATGRLEEAETLLAEAGRLAPNHPAIRTLLAKVQAGRKQAEAKGAAAPQPSP